MTTQRPPFCPPVLVDGSGSCHTIRDDVITTAQRCPGGWFGPPRPTPFGPSCQAARDSRALDLLVSTASACVSASRPRRVLDSPNSRGTKAVSPRNRLKNPPGSRCRCARARKTPRSENRVISRGYVIRDDGIGNQYVPLS